MNSDYWMTISWEILCNIPLVKLFSSAHGTRFFAIEAVFELDYCNWQHRPLQRSTHISHLVLNILKVNVKAGVMIIAIISMRKKWSSDPLQCEWKCQSLRSTDTFHLWELTTKKTSFLIKLIFFYHCSDASPQKQACSFSLLHYFYTSVFHHNANWSATQLLSKLMQHNLNWCPRKWRALFQMKHGVWVRSAVIYCSLSSALTRAGCDLAAANFFWWIVLI